MDPRCLLDHLSRGRLGAQEGALQVDPQHTIEIRFAQIEEFRGVHDPGVVDQYVDSAELPDRRIDQGVRVGLVADIRAPIHRLTAPRRDFLGERCANGVIDVAYNDPRADTRKRARTRCTDALCGPSDYCDLFVQLHAGVLASVLGLLGIMTKSAKRGTRQAYDFAARPRDAMRDDFSSSAMPPSSTAISRLSQALNKASLGESASRVG